MTIQTPEQIAAKVEHDHYNDDAWLNDPAYDGHPIDALADAIQDRCVTADEVRTMMREAVETDRTQQAESPRIWTVIGAWIEDEPVAFGAIRGEHEVGGGESGNDQPWATSVEADSHDAAVEVAVAEMLDDTTEAAENNDLPTPRTVPGTAAQGINDTATPEQIAYNLAQEWRGDRDQIVFTEATLIGALREAIEVDRAQRPQINRDNQDDQDMVRDAARVDVAWTAYDAQGRSFFTSDMGLTAAQAVGMFQGIGEAE